MEKAKVMAMMGVLMLVSRAASVSAVIDCTTVVALISACSTFVTYGSPDPIPRSPCCDAVGSLDSLADTADDRQSVCRCLMDLITTYKPNATAIATLPGFCGVSLGFIIDPNTDCNYIT
ncbi:putative non-specific lipid-transfer protein 14 [Actinidia eriantha]|uniref:putative non-specific lipid-transfer protein 14 n=1 Tax=Actinidia eriantha TaxID=165200 RepID=UPI0025868781|nr:putative non-specific lipid-transfer protein 14 [Actinidia eriantha]